MTTIFKSPLFGCCLAFLFLVATAANGADDYRFRTWVDKSGNFKIEAQFQRIKGNQVVLIKRGGGELGIDLLALSARDKEYVRLTNGGMEPNEDFDAVVKASPFIINFSQGETAYKHTVKYPWKVDIKKMLVEFTISGNGNREFPSSTLQKQPAGLGKTVKYVIRLAPKPTASTKFDLAADVEARMTYDSKNSEFIVYVKPSVDVIRGRGGAAKLALSVGECEQRVADTQTSIKRFIQEIEVGLPNQIAILNRNWNTLNGQKNNAVNANNPQLAGAILAQMAALEQKSKGFSRQVQSKRNRIPAMTNDMAYLAEIARTLRDMETITVQYRIFSKVGENSELIVDGTSTDK